MHKSTQSTCTSCSQSEGTYSFNQKKSSSTYGIRNRIDSNTAQDIHENSILTQKLRTQNLNFDQIRRLILSPEATLNEIPPKPDQSCKT